MKHDKRLSSEIRQLEGEPVPPGLQDRLMADAMVAADSARARTASPAPRWWRMRKAYLAVAFAVIMAAVGIRLLPHQTDTLAIADMARAMAKVDTVHFVGYAVDAGGKRHRLEGWVKGTNRIRIRVDGLQDIADDGHRLVAVDTGRLPKVTIRISGALQGLAQGMTYLDLFSGPGSLRSAFEANGAKAIRSNKVVLPNGAQGLVVELEGDCRSRMRIFIRASTNLLARSETYDASGRLTELIEAIQYNVPVSDALFKTSVPANLPVLDMVAPQTAQIMNDREAEFNRLQKDPNAKTTCFDHNAKPGSNGYRGSYHEGYLFQLIGPGHLSVTYLADRNVYRILGKARVCDYRTKPLSEVVEDGDIRLPGEPHIEDVLMMNGKPGEFCGTSVDDTYGSCHRFLNLGPGPATITRHRILDAYVIRGRVKLIPTGRIYENEVIRLDTECGVEVAQYVKAGGKLDWGNLPPEEIVRVNAETLSTFKSGETIAHQANPEEALNWPGLPASEIESMKADLDVTLRLSAIRENNWMINGAKTPGVHGGDFEDWHWRFEPAGPGKLTWILDVPSRHEFHIIGRARIVPANSRGQKGIIVKNGAISYHGKVISSEE